MHTFRDQLKRLREGVNPREILFGLAVLVAAFLLLEDENEK